MWLVLASLFLSTAHADNRDCVTTDYNWRVHTTDDGATWRIVHTGTVLTDRGKLDVTWHDDTKKAFTSNDPSTQLFAIEATVKQPEGKPVAEGLSAEQRLELRCAVVGGASAAAAPKPAPAPAPAPAAPKTMSRDAPAPAPKAEPAPAAPAPNKVVKPAPAPAPK